MTPGSAGHVLWPASVLPFGGAHLGEFLPPLIACCVYLALYLKRARTLARRGSGVGSWRIVSFTTGVLLVTIVQIGPLDSLGDQVLLAHMAQHIIIGDVCSLFIVLGITGPMVAPLLRLRVTRPIRALAHPVIALVLWALDLYAWHLPLLYQLAIRHDLVHALEHACLLWFGILLWAALIGPLPRPRWFNGWARLSYVIGVRTAGAVLGNVLIWVQTLLYPVYRASDSGRGLNPLSDQNVAGGIMMVEQMVLTAGLLTWLFIRWLRQEGERQELLDLAARQSIELSDERASRAAESGGAARLRDRLLGPRGSDPARP
jgi:cytochrome c oxidase assembly factor CtaG